MVFPTPEHMEMVPRWETYIVAQAVRASLGLIPPTAVRLGVAIDGEQITLVAQLPATTPQDLEDIHDIADDLAILTNLRIDSRIDIVDSGAAAPDSIWWLWSARVEASQDDDGVR